MAKRALNQKNLRPAQLNNERTFAIRLQQTKGSYRFR